MNKLLLKGKILLLMLVVLGATSCDDDDDDDNSPRLTVQTFMEQAAASDLFEIRTGTAATQKGVMTQVKTFGQKLVTDHTQTSNEMKTLASQKGVTLPTTMPQDKMQKATDLESRTGAAFDRQFSVLQVEAHQQAINLYEKAENDITDAQVQAFIDKTLPALRMHLDMAEDLKDLTD